MKRLVVLAILAAAALVAAPAGARTGIGVIAGEPTGLSVTSWLDERHAVELAPVVDLVPDTDVDRNAAIGLRF